MYADICNFIKINKLTRQLNTIHNEMSLIIIYYINKKLSIKTVRAHYIIIFKMAFTQPYIIIVNDASCCLYCRVTEPQLIIIRIMCIGFWLNTAVH